MIIYRLQLYGLLRFFAKCTYIMVISYNNRPMNVKREFYYKTKLIAMNLGKAEFCAAGSFPRPAV
jgi:hypothetical protein